MKEDARDLSATIDTLTPLRPLRGGILGPRHEIRSHSAARLIIAPSIRDLAA
jgi:hypothetical protein